MSPIHASYYTDPACPRSWGAEPSLRRLLVEFGEGVEITYVMSGLAREFGAPESLVAEWLDVAEASGMPVDPRLWLSSPPRSSYPACMAVKAASEQGLDAPYLRRLREGLACGRRKLDHAEAFRAEARDLGGVNMDRFEIDLGSHAILEAFGADLERSREAGVGGEATPMLRFAGADGTSHDVSVGEPYEAWRAAALAAGATPTTNGRRSRRRCGGSERWPPWRWRRCATSRGRARRRSCGAWPRRGGCARSDG